jgi:hypothetical protein
MRMSDVVESFLTEAERSVTRLSGFGVRVPDGALMSTSYSPVAAHCCSVFARLVTL